MPSLNASIFPSFTLTISGSDEYHETSCTLAFSGSTNIFNNLLSPIYSETLSSDKTALSTLVYEGASSSNCI